MEYENTCWSSVSAANRGIPLTGRCDNLTICVNNINYWYCDGISDINLVVKNTSVGSNIGGCNNVLNTGNTNSIILGGSGITISSSCLPNTAIVPNLAIYCTPSGSGNILCWDSSSKMVGLTTGGGSAITGATNLGNGNGTLYTSVSGNKIQLKSLSGGTNVTITCNGNYVTINSTYANAITGATNGLCVVNNKVMLGGTLTGNTVFNNTSNQSLKYSTDSSLNYTSRSLVDKGYVDSVATGLNVHAAVVAATTSGITLSGVKVIDGITTTTGMRILVKNQASGATNGIYSANTGAWGRTSDYLTNTQVTNGDLIPVTSGTTQNSSIWVLTTPDPIIVGTTSLNFTEFSTIIDTQGGAGITVTQVGGVHTICVNAANGGNATSLPVKLYNNCLVLNCSDINSAVGAMGAVTGATNLGSGNGTLYTSVNGNKIQLKSLSGGTNVTITCNGNYIAINSTSTSVGWSNLSNGTTVIGCGTVGSGCAINNNTLIGVCAGGSSITGSGNTATGYRALYSDTCGCYNVANGAQALYSDTCGCYNVANGAQALYSNTGGTGNVANGYQALYCNTKGCNNVANGSSALYSNICGCNNIANGGCALYNNTCGCNNIANGYFALYCNTTGIGNIATGTQALDRNNTGCYNIATGNGALFYNFCGSHNIATGFNALNCNTCGCCNIATGAGALCNNTSGNFNIATGIQALWNNISGCYNIASGYQALYNNTCGNCNIASGFQALYCNTKGCYNIASGYQALYANTGGTGNIAIGSGALYSNTCSNTNIAIGSSALYSSTGGTGNIATGNQALYYNTKGNYNIATGYQVLVSNTTGCNNIASGCQTLYSNIKGCNNIANGESTLFSNTTGCHNIATGYLALNKNTIGSNNIATGYQALYANTGGTCNIASGYQALYCNTKGNNNVANGNSAGYYNITGSSSIFIGRCAGYCETKSNRLYIGCNTNSSGSTLIYGEFDNALLKVCGTLNTGNLKIYNTPSGSGNILCRDASTGVIGLTTGGGSANAITGATSLGSGNAVYSTVSNNNLKFKSLSAGTNISISNNANTVTICSTGGGGSAGTDKQIIFNSGGTLAGNSYLLYDYNKISVIIGGGYIGSTSCQSVAMTAGNVCGCYSVAMGGGITYCNNSVAMAFGNACGNCSIAIGNNSVFSNNAAVIGGSFNVLCCGNDNSLLLGGNNITVNACCLPNTVIVPNLAIYCTPSGSGNILCRDSMTGVIGLTTGGGGSVGTDCQIIFNCGGTLCGNTNLLYDYMMGIVKVPNLVICCTPMGSGNILCRDSMTGAIGVTCGGTMGSTGSFISCDGKTIYVCDGLITMIM